jgi:MFS superfamily sulfate permease-like transporter
MSFSLSGLKSTSTLSSDFIASVVVFLVALPLCMGIAIASGLPPAAGLATGVIGGIVVGALSGSPLQVSGPAAGLAVVVFEIVHELGAPMLGPVLIAAGAIQLLAGRLKLGQWFRAISPAVVYGMLAGIGLLIIAGQFHVMLDRSPQPSGIKNLLAIPESILKAIFPPEGSAHHIAAMVAVLTFGVIIAWNKFKPRSLRVIPGTLVGVALGTVVASAFSLDIKHVQIPSDIWSVFALPGQDSLHRLIEPRVLLTVLTVALIASAETLLSAAAVDRMHSGPRANFDKELSAQGIGNMLCGLVGALPMTGVIVRSSANVQAGAKTRLSAMIHGVWILAFVLLFPSILRSIPMASLAAVLVFTGFRLVELEHVAKLKAYGRMPVFIYGATVAGVVAIDLLTGVMIGLGLSIVQLIWKATQLEVKTVVRESGDSTDVYLSGLATFVRLPRLAQALEAIPRPHVVHLHIQRLYHIDDTCLDLLKATAERRSSDGGVMEVHWEELNHRYHLTHLQDRDAHSKQLSAA